MVLGLVVMVCTVAIGGCQANNELEWVEEDGYRWAEVQLGFWAEEGFEQLGPDRTNVEFVNEVRDEDIIENRHVLNGSGVALGDIDGDGRIDIYLASITGENRLYKNLGDFRFEDVTEEAGLRHASYPSTGVAFADVNGNGHLDVLIASLGRGTHVYINDGGGTFELHEDSGLNSDGGNHTLALADINGDEYLDLYVVNNKTKSARDMYSMEELYDNRIVQSSKDGYALIPPFDEHYTLFVNDGQLDPREHAEEDELYINQGGERFHKVRDVASYFMDEEGNEIGLEPDWGLSAKFQDLNEDGHPDLYVANDFWTPDRVWINQGDGRFRAAGRHAFRSFSYSAMDVDFSDVNRDGAIDIFVTEMLSPFHELRVTQSMNQSPDPVEIGENDRPALQNQNTLHLNRGDQTFAEIAFYSGVAMSGWSWTVRFMDVDLDGYEDLLIATGYGRDGRDLDTQAILGQRLAAGRLDSDAMVLEFPERSLRNVAFKNNRDLTFSEVGAEWGFKDEDISQGLAVADLNNDGALDIVVNRMNNPASIYRNKTNKPRIAVRLKGSAPNTRGIGAKIEVEGGPVEQTKEISAGGDYLSSSDPLAVFAAHEGERHSVKVTWPDQSVSRIDGLESNRIYEIYQGEGVAPDKSPDSKVEPSLFLDVSDAISHRSAVSGIDDFSVQPLLPLKLSNLGPGVAWVDVSEDGRDDLLVGSNRESEITLFENQDDGASIALEADSIEGQHGGVAAAVLGWREHGDTKLVVRNSHYDLEDEEYPSAYSFDMSDGKRSEWEELPPLRAVGGPIAAADYNGDGYVDVFMGGRFTPGRYPKDAPSLLLLNDGKTFEVDDVNSATFDDIGLVSDALFFDYNNDGSQDLLVGTEWGAIRLFENRGGRLVEVTGRVGLSQFTGLWNGVAVGDFNNDGLADIVGANVGKNSIYSLNGEGSIRIYYDDISGDGRVNIVEAYSNSDEEYMPLRRLDELDRSIVNVTRHIDTHEEFSSYTVADMFGDRIQGLAHKEVNTKGHMLFVNEGDRFTAKPLPEKTQWTSAFSVNVADFDNDGNEDLFLSQNLFSLPEGRPRLDAGRGLVMLGDGQGGFNPLSAAESGISIHGEQRGAATNDFNQDGKVDVVVTQVGDETKLYENRTPNRGLRVRLQGPSTNGDAIGSSLRIVYESGGKGPRRFVQAGGGRWSQNSLEQILGVKSDPVEIEVTWFDGAVSTRKVDAGQDRYLVSHPDVED